MVATIDVTLLGAALAGNRLQTARFLHQYGADDHDWCDYGLTPLYSVS